jgi:peptidyl-Asp metalloendopeptidase
VRISSRIDRRALMRAKRGSLPLFVLTLLLSGVLDAVGESKPLLAPTNRQGSLKLKPHRTVIRQRPVVVDFGELKKDNRRLELPLFGDTKVVLVRDEKESGPSGVFVWEGEVEGQPGSMAILATTKKILFGDVMTRDSKGSFGFYQIRYLGNGVHVLKEVDQSKFPEEEGKKELQRGEKAIRSRDPKEASGFYLARYSESRAHSEVLVPTSPPTCEDPATQIDALVVYTDDARDEAGGKDSMTLLIESAVRSTNRSYLKSGVTQRLRLVHTERVEYSESTSLLTDRERLVDGRVAGVRALRNTHAADVVVLIVKEHPLDCGWSKVMPTVSDGNETEAYAVVPHDCAGLPRWSFAHELGHIMGARHNRDDDDIEGKPFAFNHGLVRRSAPAGSRWHTIMAKALPECGAEDNEPCTSRIPWWSNPSVRYPDASGELTGDADNDNHKALEETALTVANYRCASR